MAPGSPRSEQGIPSPIELLRTKIDIATLHNLTNENYSLDHVVDSDSIRELSLLSTSDS